MSVMDVINQNQQQQEQESELKKEISDLAEKINKLAQSVESLQNRTITVHAPESYTNNLSNIRSQLSAIAGKLNSERKQEADSSLKAIAKSFQEMVRYFYIVMGLAGIAFIFSFLAWQKTDTTLDRLNAASGNLYKSLEIIDYNQHFSDPNQMFRLDEYDKYQEARAKK